MLTEPDHHATVTALDAGWRGAPSPAVLVAADGAVLAANEAARSVLPDLIVGASIEGCGPAWLVAADRAARPGAAPGTVEGVEGAVGERTFTAHRVDYPDGAAMWWLTETTDLHRSHEDLLRERERASFLRAASDELLSSLNAARTMEVAAEYAVGRLADAAWIVEPPVRGRHTAVVCMRGQRPRRMVLTGRTDDLPGLAEALQGFPPVPSRWIDAASAPAWVMPEGFGPAGSVIVTSLPGHGVSAGALVLLRGADAAAFDEAEEAVARLFAARVGAALSAARLFEEQATVTEALAAELLPPPLRQVDGVEFAGIYRPALAASQLGGDFYDVHPLEDGGALALLGDVCGKGLDAAVFTGKIRNTLHALLPLADDHGRVLELLNAALLGAREPRFATMVLASVRRAGECVEVALSRAGHLPPLIVRTDGRVEEVASAGELVGVLPALDVETETVVLAPGEVCLLYTDGITEARGGPLGGELFGEDRLREALSGCAGMPADALVQHVLMLATEWLGDGAHDDMAVLAIGAPGTR